MGRRPSISGPVSPLQSNRRRRILHEELHAAAASLPPQRSTPGRTAPPAPIRRSSRSRLPSTTASVASRVPVPDARAARGSTRVGTSPPRPIRRRRASIRRRGGWSRPSRGRSWPEDGAPPLRLLPSPRHIAPTPCAPLSMAYQRCTEVYRN
jgi:hypothetical protein